MNLSKSFLLATFLLPALTLAQTSNPTTQNAGTLSAAESAAALYTKTSPSLVAVQFTFEYEFGRLELTGPGLLVSEDGLVMLPIQVLSPGLPEEQLKDFKVIIPGHGQADDEELDATLVCRDERTQLSFIRVKTNKDKPRKFPFVKFEPRELNVGESVFSVGLLAKSAGYKTYFNTGLVGANLVGDVPEVMVIAGGLASVGAPVFDSAGRAVGYVNAQQGQSMLLDTAGGQEVNAVAPVLLPPHFYVPASDFMQSFEDMPTPENPQHIPWAGITKFKTVKKEVAEVFGLEGKPAAEIGDVVPNSPADKAGLKAQTIITEIDGKPLPRGDGEEETAGMITRRLGRMKVGESVQLTIIGPDKKPAQTTLKLEERPKRAPQAKRHWFADLEFSVREVVFADTYERKLPPDTKGVVVARIKPSGAAASGHLDMNQLVTSINNDPVTDLEGFIKSYEAARKSKPKEAIVLVVTQQDGTTQTIRIEPPQ